MPTFLKKKCFKHPMIITNAWLPANLLPTATCKNLFTDLYFLAILPKFICELNIMLIILYCLRLHNRVKAKKENWKLIIPNIIQDMAVLNVQRYLVLSKENICQQEVSKDKSKIIIKGLTSISSKGGKVVILRGKLLKLCRYWLLCFQIIKDYIEV